MRQLRALVIVGALVIAGQAAARQSGAPTSHKVKRGDTLSGIAKKYKTTVDALVAANALSDPDRILQGQTLALVPPAPNTPKTQLVSSTKPSPLSNDVFVAGASGLMAYKVVKGDNLTKLAQKFGTTTAELRRLNNMKPNKSTIRTGQTLNAPGAAWTCPVAGKPRDFSDSWGAPRHGGRHHMGTDIFAYRGTPVVAPVSGKLSFRNGSIGGKAFYLDGADGVRYYGAHLDSIDAKAGNIEAGAKIGTVGDTGNAKGTTPHLHFEIHPKGKAVNPIPTLNKWCT